MARETKKQRIEREEQEIQREFSLEQAKYPERLMKALERVSEFPGSFVDFVVQNFRFNITYFDYYEMNNNKDYNVEFFSLPYYLYSSEDLRTLSNLEFCINQEEKRYLEHQESEKKKANALAKLTDEEKKILNLNYF